MINIIRKTLWALLLLPTVAMANLGVTYHGRMLKASNEPVVGSVEFRIQILSPGSEKCLMYQEKQVHTIVDGVFALTVGSGQRVLASVDGGYSIDKIFANRGSFDFSSTSPSACHFGSAYSPNAADTRIVKVLFNDGTGWDEMPEQAISWTPYAINAHSVGGFTKDELLRVEGSNISPLSNAEYNKLKDLINGTSSSYVTTANLNSAITNLGSLASMTPTGTASSSTYLRGDGTWATLPTSGGGGVGTVTSVSGVTGQITVSNADSTPSVGLASTGVTVGTYGALNKTLSSISVDAFGRISAITESPIALNANQITAGTLTIAQGGTGATTLAANRLLMMNGLGTAITHDTCVIGQMLQFDGTQWECVAPPATTAGTAPGTFAAGDDPRLVAAANSFTIGGNGKEADLRIGTTDLHALSVVTNNLERLKVQSDGNISVGLATAATEKLEVDGRVKAAGFCLGADCLTAWPTAGTSGVTEVTAAAPLTISNTTTTPSLSLNIGQGLQNSSSSLAVRAGTGITVTAGGVNVIYGSTASTAVEGNDPRLSNSRAPSGAAGGDLGGTYPNPSVTKIQGRSVASTAPEVGQVLKWDGNAWVPSVDVGIATETDPTVPSWAKGTLPSCSPGQVLFANGNTMSCVTVDVASQDPSYRCLAGSVTYSTAGSYSFDMFDIPSGCRDVKIEIKGAGGGSGATHWAATANGQAGGSAEIYINRDRDKVINVVVGGGGSGGATSSALGGLNGGGAGGRGYTSIYGGAGGGRTEVSLGGATIAIVGGGGGSGGAAWTSIDMPSYSGASATKDHAGSAGISSGSWITEEARPGFGQEGGAGGSANTGNTSSGGGGGGGGSGCYGGGGGSAGSRNSYRGGNGGRGSTCLDTALILSGVYQDDGGSAGGEGVAYTSNLTSGQKGVDGAVTISWGPTINTCVAGSASFETSGNHVFPMSRIPSKCKTVRIVAKGAGGGSGAANWGVSSPGRSGGSSEFYVNRNHLSFINMVIGGGGLGGGASGTGLGGFNGGGAGGRGYYGGIYGGGGAGRTTISLDSTIVAVIGGGGGSGGAAWTSADMSNYSGTAATKDHAGSAGINSGSWIAEEARPGLGQEGGAGGSAHTGNSSSGGGGGGGGSGCYGGGGGAAGSRNSSRGGYGGSGSSCIYPSLLLSGTVNQSGGNSGGAEVPHNTTSNPGFPGTDGSVTIYWSP